MCDTKYCSIGDFQQLHMYLSDFVHYCTQEDTCIYSMVSRQAVGECLHFILGRVWARGISHQKATLGTVAYGWSDTYTCIQPFLSVSCLSQARARNNALYGDALFYDARLYN